ncbi:MAG: Do family serine endopeptidase [Acidobacteria bacterium]|nr:Do family serine endopeptidase [Acidobacteriota bacterium]
MRTWLLKITCFRGRCLVAPAIALALAGTVLTYEAAKPAFAKAPAVAPTASPLDDNSVGALLSLDHAMETLAARVTPAVVNVAVTSRNKSTPAGMDEQLPGPMERFFGPGFGFGGNRHPESQIEHGIGSGVLISPDGYIVTNNHVIDGAVEMRVTLSDRRVLSAKLVGADRLTDVAVIKVDGTNLPNVPWGDSKALHPGQTVLAFGNPFGLRFTVTRGIVSALNRPNPDAEDRRKPGEYIQTDAAINQGNSGGALVNARGELVGINTFLLSPSGAFSGMGFAIPSQIVRPTVEALVRDGEVVRGYMGIGITDVTPENAQFFHVPDSSGAVVDQVESNSPAAKAGIKVGDVIRGIDSQKVTGAGDLQVEVGQKRPGRVIQLELLRDGKTLELPVTLEAMRARADDESASAAAGRPRWGLGLQDLTPEIRQQLQAPSDIKGAVVERVQPGSSADDAGLRSGDVIVEVNRHAVHSAADVEQQLASVATGRDALVLVWSSGASTFRVLHSSNGAS